MDLFLIRHADAADGHLHRADAERPLTAEGRRKALRVGAALAKHGARFGAIVASPLVRAVQTAELLAVATGYDGALTIEAALEPGGEPEDMLACARRATPGPVALVGHEPSMGHLLASLVGVRAVAFSKGAVVRLAWDPIEQRARFLWVVTPKRLDPTDSLDAL